MPGFARSLPEKYLIYSSELSELQAFPGLTDLSIDFHAAV